MNFLSSATLVRFWYRSLISVSRCVTSDGSMMRPLSIPWLTYKPRNAILERLREAAEPLP